jgi:mono/diheme cytochrome c family protein
LIYRFYILLISISFLELFPCRFYYLRTDKPTEENRWNAPLWADTLISSVKDVPKAIVEGRKIYSGECAVCHGITGAGDGESGFGLDTTPGDLTDVYTQTESDGAIYWKITFGRKQMPSFQSRLSDLKRWQIVAYIRELQRLEILKRTKGRKQNK